MPNEETFNNKQICWMEFVSTTKDFNQVVKHM